MLVRLGYVAMSVHPQNASPSQTMTFAQFQRLKDREAAIRKLERIANSNLENCLRLLKHNSGIEAKRKDEALFQLMHDMQKQEDIEIVDGASFYVK